VALLLVGPGSPGDRAGRDRYGWSKCRGPCLSPPLVTSGETAIITYGWQRHGSRRALSPRVRWRDGAGRSAGRQPGRMDTSGRVD